MRILLVILMVLGTSSVFAKKRSHNKKINEVTHKRSKKGHAYDRGFERGYNRSEHSWRRHGWRNKKHYGRYHGRKHRRYHKRPVRVVRYERQPRYIYWPRFSVVLDL